MTKALFNHMRLLILTIPVLLGLTVTACINDSFTTSPHDLLTFSTDTVSFDTVFTGQGTPTARLLVYNKAKKSVNISEIRFRNEDTRFQLNVDGQSGRVFHDVEIRGNDFIYVFIECFIPESQGAEPALTEDKLMFLTNGVEQDVQVEAYGQNVTRLKAVTLTADTRFTADRPIVVYDSLVVAEGATLTIDPEVRLLFHDKARLTVHGTLRALGEPGKMIDMRGDRLDNVLPDIGYDILAGQWEGVRFAAGSFDNVMQCVNMRSTVSGLRVDSCGDLSRQKLTLVNSWLHNSQGRAFESSFAKVDAYGCIFSEAAKAVVALRGGEHRFDQCTLANNYLFAAVSEPLLFLEHLLPDELEDADMQTPQPLMRANFENCIIYGLGSDINVGDLAGSEVFLRNVSLKGEGENDDNFIDCLFDCDPDFYAERSEYLFDYRVRPDSPVIGAGNPEFVTPGCLIDMFGTDRLASGAPTLGALQFLPAPEE